MTLLNTLAFLHTLPRGAIIAAVLAAGATVTGAVLAYVALHATSRGARR